MINVVIFLHEINEAKELTDLLLREKLVAHANIDETNITYTVENDEIVRSVNSVITAQTKALLFSDIERFVIDMYGDKVQIFSMPITQSSHTFDSLIRNNTRKA